MGNEDSSHTYTEPTSTEPCRNGGHYILKLHRFRGVGGGTHGLVHRSLTESGFIEHHKIDFHDFGNYWKATSSQNGLKTFLFVTVFGNTIFLQARVSVANIRPMNFQKIAPQEIFP
jgi:hypothetical protein